ncbi:MAG TPA: hypothetical protein VFG58_00050, partial [Solirubrobacterales bacterium]|nr:hypothetical protein [Solirubrobacterales bacterium]
MTFSATLKWLGLALLGIAVAAAVAIAAGNLAGQQIGLSSEPISAGDALAPRAASQANPKVEPEPASPPEKPAPEPTTSPETTTPPAETQPSPEGSDDSPGGG